MCCGSLNQLPADRYFRYYKVIANRNTDLYINITESREVIPLR